MVAVSSDGGNRVMRMVVSGGDWSQTVVVICGGGDDSYN